MFIINCKNYKEISGEKLDKLVRISEKISKKYKIKIAIAPPQHLLASITKRDVIVLAQHVDDAKVGSSTGFLVAELLKDSKVNGSLINHSEHRIPSKDIKSIVDKLHSLKMITVVCVRNVREAEIYSKLNPDYIAIEPPELIGSGKAISKERPELITKSVDIIKDAKKTKLLCGAGIISGLDVAQAKKLGSKGILVASGILKAKNWDKIIDEFAKAMK